MADWRDDVWFWDMEVFQHDWMLCALSAKTREKVHFDTRGMFGKNQLVDWLNAERPLLVGYNCKNYDSYILKAILAGGSPEDVYAVSKAIIVEGMQGWEIQMGIVVLPDIVDLMLDLPTRPSLKMIEGNLRMSVEESSVPFDTERPSDSQWEDIEEYCWHDVEALVPLYKAREDYLKAKETLAEMKGMDVKKALNMTNAKLTAKFLDAVPIERTDERDYVYPQNIDRTLIPEAVFEFFDRLPHSDIPLDVLFGKEGVEDEEGKVVKSRNPYRSLSIVIADCPHVIGWGGLHGARLNYVEKSDDKRTVLNYDVQSYYPSLMIVNKYLSRNISNPEVFEDVYKKRIEAKRGGDKKTADALKLVINTTYGASNNRYNDLYDPLMAHSVCISGQLYLVMLINTLDTEIGSFRLIQSNTDGIMFSAGNEDVPAVRRVVENWQKLTGFVMEETVIESVVQRDVNNYVMREAGGKIKVKGGVVSDYKGGDFKHNSLSIVCKAIVDNLLDGIPVEKTIGECNDPFAFQMIAKAGGTYERVVHVFEGGERQINKVNRIYASPLRNLGAVYKVKADGRRDRQASCPEHAIIDNEGTITIDKLDKQWYIDLANERLLKFRGVKSEREKRRKKMDEEDVVIIDEDEPVETEVKKKTRKRTQKKEKEMGEAVQKEMGEAVQKEVQEVDATATPVKTVMSFEEKLFKLGQDIAEMSTKMEKDGYNSAQSYEYVKASQYKTMLRKALAMNRLRYVVNDMSSDVSDVLKGDKMVLTQYHAQIVIKDVDSDESESYLIWSQGADMLDKGLSKAKTLAIKDFVKSQFLVSDGEDDPEADVVASPVAKKAFVSPTEKKDIVSGILAKTSAISDEQKTTITKLIGAIREKSGNADYGAKTLAKLDDMTSTEATVALTKLELKGNEYGLEI
jgi:hypothetical protein